MSSTQIFVSVRDRLQLTVDCIRLLIDSTHGQADIHIFDNGSQQELVGLLQQYNVWYAEGAVASVHLNTLGMLNDHECYWSKNYSWQQFLKMVEVMPEEERGHLVMVDNDVMCGPGWLPMSLRLLKEPQMKENNVVVVSPYDGAPFYEEEKVVELYKRKIKIQTKLSSRLWVAPYEWWKSMEPPPYEAKTVEAGGKKFKDRHPTDAWYFSKMAEKGERFGVMRPPMCTDANYNFPSARKMFGIGADWDEEYRELSGMGKLEGWGKK